MKDYNPFFYHNIILQEKWNITNYNLAILHENSVNTSKK